MQSQRKVTPSRFGGGRREPSPLHRAQPLPVRLRGGHCGRSRLRQLGSWRWTRGRFWFPWLGL